MRVLMTADTVGGVWSYAVELAGALAEHDVEIVLATMGRPASNDQQRQLRAIGNVTHIESSYRLEWMHEPWEDVALAGKWLLRLRDEFQPDLVHLNSYSHGSLEWNCPAVITAHSCVLSWWRAVHGETPPQRWGVYRRAVAAGLRAADLIIAPTREMARCIRQNYAVQREIHVIPNGRTAGPFAPGPKHPFVFSAGRMWDPAKNLAVLDEAAAGLPWNVYVAGSIDHPEAGPSVHAQNVRTFGALSIEELGTWLSRADIYALPARYEPFGLSILEAALAQCALVLGDIPSLRENWEGAAIFAEPHDCDALREALRSLIFNPVQRRALAGRAYERASTMTPALMAEQYLGVYERLVQGCSALSHETSASMDPGSQSISGRARDLQEDSTCASSFSTTR